MTPHVHPKDGLLCLVLTAAHVSLQACRNFGSVSRGVRSSKRRQILRLLRRSAGIICGIRNRHTQQQPRPKLGLSGPHLDFGSSI